MSIVKKSGNSYMYEEEKLGVGRETAKQYLRENPKLVEKIRKAIIEKSDLAKKNAE
ncbi:MAG: recombinase A [Parcubacteria group bacterium GW2011_GWC2_38_7]|nr:MAG: recombinase A [Parcubacteria group bacterium GW2011_GWC2_38_7]